MKNRSVGISKSIIASFLLSFTLIFVLTGCLHRPLILRNRPDVPPPVIEPTGPVTLIGVDDTDIIVSDEPISINIPESLPRPDIKTAPVTYTVQKGDSFWKIGRMYGVSQEELAACNNLSVDKPLKIGTTLLIPPGGEFVPTDMRPQIKKSPKKNPNVKKTSEVEYNPSPEDGTYVVKPGDSLWKIARRYKITSALLAKANNLEIRQPLQIGQKLVIPGVGGNDPDPVEVIPEKVPEMKDPDPTEIIDGNSKNGSTNLLDDAENAIEKDPGDTDTESPGNAEEVIDEELIETATETETETEVRGSLYVEEVLPNETLQDIAKRHGFTPEQIRAVNPGLPADGKLKPFTSIKIPNK